MLRRKIFLFLLIVTMLFISGIVAHANTTDVADTHTVTFMESGSVIKTLEIANGETVKEYPMQDSSENFILGWVVNGKRISDPSAITIDKDTVFSVWKAPYVNLSSHHSYINGSNGQFRPNDSLSRAEFCVIFSSLFNIYDNGCTNFFPDVTINDWFYAPVSKIISAGIMSGYENGSFGPNNKMTRAEFISVLCSGSVFGESEDIFDDTTNHWAKNPIGYAYKNGWISADENNNFRPDEPITRAEAVVIFNKILGRSAFSITNYLTENNICPFYDVKHSDPYYFDIMEATIDHSYTGKGNEEVWTNFEYKNCGYGPGFVHLNNNGYYIDKNGQFCHMPSWSFVEIDGNTYLTNGEGAVDLSRTGLAEIYGSMFCFTDTGRILKNEYFENLYFGADGKYTSGNTKLDQYVDDLLAKTTNAGMSKEQKLYSAYIYIRDNGKYLGRKHYDRGTSDFTEEAALFMFENSMKGNCYCFASCFLYVARRLGYEDAYIVSGGVGKKNLNHAWVMIGSNIYDVELEYAHLYQYEVKHHYNLFNMPIIKEPFHYYFPN